MTGTLGEQLIRILVAAWGVTGQMAPYLLLGFLMAGLFSVWISPAWVERRLGKKGGRSSLLAALFGVPLPLCSCGVIPVAASLRRHGASRGATAAFLMSTPQTGVDSLLVTWGLLGPVMAVFRALVAFLSGSLCGMLVDRMDAAGPEESAGSEDEASGPRIRRPWPVQALRHGFVVLTGDIHKAVLLGLLISGALGALLPPSALGEHIGQGLGAMLLMLLVGIPLYVCSTASVPIALALMHAGVSPGAALVFLVTGPATNAAMISAMVRLLGLRSTVIYLGVLVITAIGSGFALDGLLARTAWTASCEMHIAQQGLGSHLAAAVLLAVLIAPFIRRRMRK
ncbi:MAG: permease [Kiritimatiellia bacterium]|nr:permease [Kiritimatiellia bacterium]